MSPELFAAIRIWLIDIPVGLLWLSLFLIKAPKEAPPPFYGSSL